MEWKRQILLSGAVVLALSLSSAVRGMPYHVDGFYGNDGNDGSSREAAFKTIQKGIISAANDDTVLVWPGVYSEACNFMGKAITVRSAADAAVLEAPSNYAMSFYSGEGVDSVLEHFVIRNSYAGIQAVGADPTIRFVTVVNNDHGIIANITADPNINHSILWNNTYGDLIDCQATYSCVQDGDSGTGNISVDPNFAGRAYGDFHLLSERGRYMPVDPCDFNGKEGFWVLDEVTSPCIDAGDPALDESIEPMPNGARINIGAYGGTAYASRSEWPLAPDLNFDREVNLLDFAIMADKWLEIIPETEPVYGWSAPSLLIPRHGNADKVMASYVTPDKLTMFYSQGDDPNNNWEIVEATRSDPRGSFTTTRYYPELNGGLAPWVSMDRLRMYYNEKVDGIAIIKIAERADPNSSWTLVRTVSEIQEPGYSDYRPVLTADELTMFWGSYRPVGGVSTTIWMATRSSTSDPFSNVTQVSELNIHTMNEVPYLLPDGLTIYFQAASTGHPWMFYKATRNSLQDPFTNISEVTMFDGSSFDGHSIFVTPDERDLYFHSEWMGQGEGIHVSYNNTPYSFPRIIHHGTAVVDGDLSDWSSHPEWLDLDQIYYGDPNDITEAKVAFRWDANTNKIYAAVVVTDTDHIFTDDFVTWDASDRIEIFSQGSAAGGTGFYGNYGIAQHYMVGPDTTGGSWGTWALGQTTDPNANFEYAVQVSGNQIKYEIGITQFDYYGGIADGDSVLTYLYPGKTVRLDIIANTRYSSDFGTLSENLMTGKHLNADKFAQYRLVE